MQTLIRCEEDIHNQSDRKPVLVKAVEADQGCDRIYKALSQRTKDLVGSNGITFTVEFDWRMRVGGTRGFCDLLLPVFHPVFGIPYIPASTLKGATRAWAEAQENPRINELLGMLKGDVAKAAKVEFLDAFPTSSCLSVDIANPQWKWEQDAVKYGSSPFPSLSMERPKFLLGIMPTNRGERADAEVVKLWLESACKTGIGSRISSGYGRTIEYLASMPYAQSYKFDLWTEGMYGYNPPAKDNYYKGTHEFRPSAVRGILRYWFRAMAMGLYSPEERIKLESKVFGKLGEQGKVLVSAQIESCKQGEQSRPFEYSGQIHIEAKEEDYRKLVSGLLILASHIGGFGRGSRRPLHTLDRRMRGCHWFVDCGEELRLGYDREQWKKFFQRLRNAFVKIKPLSDSYTFSSSEEGRCQDVFDRNAQIWLLRSPNQISPMQVKNWGGDNVRGAGLDLLYSDKRFKGVGRNPGNLNVGGKLGIPSFVWIKSIFPPNDSPYQVISIFGANHPDRLAFAQALQAKGAVLVIGEMPDESQVNINPTPRPDNPRPLEGDRQRLDRPKLKR